MKKNQNIYRRKDKRTVLSKQTAEEFYAVQRHLLNALNGRYIAIWRLMFLSDDAQQLCYEFQKAIHLQTEQI